MFYINLWFFLRSILISNLLISILFNFMFDLKVKRIYEKVLLVFIFRLIDFFKKLVLKK